MLDLYIIGPIILLLLSGAFFLIWSISRSNHAALMWGVAHAAYGIGIVLAFQYQLQPSPWLGYPAVLAFSIYLTTFWLAIDVFEGKHIGLVIVLAYLVGISIAEIGVNQISGRAAVVFLSVVVLTRAGIHFYGKLQMRWVAAAFFLKATSYLSAFAALDTFGTYHQPLWMYLLHWSTNLLLALTLVSIAVQQSRHRLLQVLQHLPDAIVATKMDGTVLFCNEAFAKLCSTSGSTSLLGKRVPLLSDDFAEVAAMSKQIKKSQQADFSESPVVIEREVATLAGHSFPAEVMFSHFRDFGERVILAQIHDQSERKKAEEDRLRLATIDETTGLPNRILLERRLSVILKESARNENLCAVLIVDLDRFMRVNDTMGHAAGDDLIAKVAALLATTVRPIDVLGRFGGDEFLIIVPLLSTPTATAIAGDLASKVCSAIARTFSINGVDIRLGASVGVALMTSVGDSAANLIQRAEMAMFESKSRERGGWTFFDEKMNDKLRLNVRMEAALRLAIERSELQLLYQPIYACSDGTLVKVEALIRWNSSEFGLVRPDSFIPILEQSALILEIGKWVLEEAVRQSAQWQQSCQAVPVVSINISARQFLQHNFEFELMDLLRKYRVRPEHIELELTESLLAADDHDLIALLQRLGQAGISISLDDFGTGYSSLSYLARFNVDTVKIDQSFVADLEFDERHRALVKVIIAMGHSLGLKVVAEGVETTAQKDFLLSQYCDYMQGYLFSEPVPPSKIDFQKNSYAQN